MRPVKYAALLLVSLLLVACNDTEEPEAVSFEGTWEILSGAYPEGGTYRGVMQATRMSDGYNLTWVVDDSLRYQGVGLVKDSTLYACWGRRVSFGVMVYEVASDSSGLRGTWAMDVGRGKLGYEKATGAVRKDLAGSFDLRGTNPGGEMGYRGAMTLTPRTFTWHYACKTALGNYQGVGIQDGKRLAIGWAQRGTAYGVAVYKRHGNRLTSTYANQRLDWIGTETLRLIE